RDDQLEILIVLNALAEQYVEVNENATAERVYNGLLELLSPETEKHFLTLVGRAITFLNRRELDRAASILNDVLCRNAQIRTGRDSVVEYAQAILDLVQERKREAGVS